MEIITETNEMTLFINILSDMICQYLDAQSSVLADSLAVPAAQVVSTDQPLKAA
ncbi:hypothetical protein [Paenibacillus sp. FSL R7-0179]|uniref:hypothetical protein n=1 Tax=Paenibacillus sp. FSL R7-0179 TaxID=2921672 RepID=UPI0030FC45A7